MCGPRGGGARDYEENYRSVIESASEAICITQDGLIRFFNPAGAKLTGHSEEDLLAKPFAALTHPDDLEDLVRIYQQRLRGEHVTPGHRFRIITAAGEVRVDRILFVLNQLGRATGSSVDDSRCFQAG